MRRKYADTSSKALEGSSGIERHQSNYASEEGSNSLRMLDLPVAVDDGPASHTNGCSKTGSVITEDEEGLPAVRYLPGMRVRVSEKSHFGLNAQCGSVADPPVDEDDLQVRLVIDGLRDGRVFKVILNF